MQNAAYIAASCKPKHSLGQMEQTLIEGSDAGGFPQRFLSESKKLWKIAGPAIFTSVCQYSLGAVTQTFAGHVGTLELAAVSVENSVVAGFAFGILLGMGSALQTLCGQAFGAGKLRMLGIYMQRSWVILLCTALLLVPVYVFSPSILVALGEDSEIASLSGKFAIWMLPQLFAYALNFPIQRFLQSQRKVMAIAMIAGLVVAVHVFLSWILMVKFQLGLVGAAVSLNSSWWIFVFGQLAYILAGSCGSAWSGFSWLAFAELYEFVKLSLASAVMLWVMCSLEYWYLMLLIVLTGHLANPLIVVDAVSICMNISGWDMMIAIGFNAAIGVRVSNELGACNPRAARFSVIVVSITSISIGILIMLLILMTKNSFPYLFSDSSDVAEEVTKLAGLLSVTVALNSLQPVLSGVAVGAGWQALVAYINIGCYYVVGLPTGLLLGFKFHLGVQGIWGGLIGGIALQTVILIGTTACTNWSKEAAEAESRVRRWGGALGLEQE